MNWETYDINDVLDRKAGENSISDDRILQHAKENKLIIVTKDQGLKLQCYSAMMPFVSLGSPQEEANIVNQKLNEMLAWKEYF